LTKLVAALPVNLRAQAATIRQRLFVDATGWRGTTENLAALPVVQDAVWRGRQLRVTYQPSGRAADDRVVHPLGMVAKGTTWYLVADTVKGLRTFRISRILAAAALDVPCVRPAKFDLETHWRTSGDAYREKPRYPATLILEPATASSLCEWMEMRPLPAEQSDPSGWSRWRVDFESASQAGFIALGLGTKVVVVEPADLRRDVVGEHRAAAAGRAAPRSGRRRRQPLP
jgi:predicted DNA-binding transcriptional regulator YafY